MCIPWDICVWSKFIKLYIFNSLSFSQEVAPAYNPKHSINWRKQLGSSGVTLLHIKLKMETLHKSLYEKKQNPPLPSLTSL